MHIVRRKRTGLPASRDRSAPGQDISWRTGKKLRFDAKTETFDDKDANQYLGREHRKGFELPDIG